MSAIPHRPYLRIATESHPVYEMRATGLSGSDIEIAIWQVPSPATPRLHQPERTAALSGRPWRMIEARALKRLKNAGINIATIRKGQTISFQIDEDLALNIALLFRLIAPM